MNEMMRHFKQKIRAHLGALEGATSQLANDASGPVQTQAALNAAYDALATIEVFLRAEKTGE